MSSLHPRISNINFIYRCVKLSTVVAQCWFYMGTQFNPSATDAVCVCVSCVRVLALALGLSLMLLLQRICSVCVWVWVCRPCNWSSWSAVVEAQCPPIDGSTHFPALSFLLQNSLPSGKENECRDDGVIISKQTSRLKNWQEALLKKVIIVIFCTCNRAFYL